MKIVMLGFSKLIYMPYAYFYMERTKANNNEIHIVSWNRDGDDDIEPLPGVIVHEFKCQQQNQIEKTSKIKNFIKYRKYAISVLKIVKPDLIICLHTLPGIVLFDRFIYRYKNKFLYDYRDSTYEKNLLFRKMVGMLVKKSIATFVSSDGFRRYLPAECENKIITSHNITDDLIKREIKYDIKNNRQSVQIRIGFWGIIRNESFNRLIIERVANREQIELHYFGREEKVAINLKSYCADVLKASNIFFHGAYKPEDRFDFSKNIDIVHNMYNDKNMMIAVSNKLYDGIFLMIPQVCFEGSYMGKIVEDRKVGVALNPNDEDFVDKMIEYYTSLDKMEFTKACLEAREDVIQQYRRAGDVVEMCIKPSNGDRK